MSRADDYEIRCDTQGCATTVRLDDDPAALRPCGHVICAGCHWCFDCPPPARGRQGGRSMIRRLQTAYAITVFIAFNKLIEYGDDQLADLGGED